MIPTILVAIDETPQSQSAVACALALPGTTRAHAIVMWVGDPDRARGVPDEVARVLASRSITAEVQFVGEADRAEAVCRTALTRQADLVVLAPQPFALPTEEAQGIARDVVLRSFVPVLVTPPGLPHRGRAGPRGVLTAALPFDGSDEFEAVLPALHRLRRWMPLALRFVGFAGPDDPYELIDQLVRLRVLSWPFERDRIDIESWAIPTVDAPGDFRELLAKGEADMAVLPVLGEWLHSGGRLGALASAVAHQAHFPQLFVRVEAAFPAVSCPIPCGST